MNLYSINFRRDNSHSQLAPSAVQAGNAVVTLDRLSTFGALPVTIPLDPMMDHRLRCLFTFHVGGYARGWRSLHASLVHRVFANWFEKKKEISVIQRRS